MTRTRRGQLVLLVFQRRRVSGGVLRPVGRSGGILAGTALCERRPLPAPMHLRSTTPRLTAMRLELSRWSHGALRRPRAATDGAKGCPQQPCRLQYLIATKRRSFGSSASSYFPLFDRLGSLTFFLREPLVGNARQDVRDAVQPGALLVVRSDDVPRRDRGCRSPRASASRARE